jgi:hypothetical protein
MNPYEASTDANASIPVDVELKFTRAFYSCVRVTVLLMIAATIPISSYVDQTYRPNMGMWVIPYVLSVVMTSVPIGFLAAYASRTAKKKFSSPLVPLSASLAMAMVPYLMIPPLKDVQLGFFIQTLLLLFWTTGAPFFLGITVYFFETRKLGILS